MAGSWSDCIHCSLCFAGREKESCCCVQEEGFIVGGAVVSVGSICINGPVLEIYLSRTVS
jgi:hypothetical protein